MAAICESFEKSVVLLLAVLLVGLSDWRCLADHENQSEVMARGADPEVPSATAGALG
jgi:hypothetical protein